MSLADFSQYAEDHARLFVFVKALGETSGALYGAIVDSLLEFPPVPVRDSLVFVRLENRLPRWAKEGQQRWQQFQPHKRILGFLGITQCHDAEDLEIVEAEFKKERDKFSSSVCASQCMVFGSRADLEVARVPSNFHLVEFDNSRSFTKPEVEIDQGLLSRIVSKLVEGVLQRVQKEIEESSRRLEAGGRLDALQSPLEGREGENEDEAKMSRTQKMGRINKHIADLHLLSGQLQSACDHFGLALTQLSRDPLWEGSANEGLGATLIMKKKQDELLGQRTAELSMPSNVIGLLKVPQRILKQRELSRKRGQADPGVVGGGGGGGGGVVASTGPAMANGRASLYRRPKSPIGGETNNNDDSIDSIEEDGMESELDGTDETGIKTDCDDEETKLLQKDLVVDRFTRAELQFRKAGAEGGVSRIELLFKFARYLVSQERHKAATEILQKIYWTCCYINDLEKSTLYQAMAMVFQSMNYHRKASLLLYWAALQAARVSAKTQDKYESNDYVHKAHNLLTQCLPGYKLSMAAGTSVVEATTSEPSGWPLLQAVVMKDLVYLTQHTDQNSLLLQFSCILLQRLHHHLSETSLQKVIQYLEAVTRAQQQTNTPSSPTSSPKALSSPLHRQLSRNLSTDNLISPLPLSEFPRICGFRPKHFPPHLRPHRTVGSTTKGPFIVSQLHGKREQRPEILWVVHDSGEIAVDIFNPLQFELRVENMKLTWKGVPITACPSSLSLPQEEKQDFTLTALPQAVGELQLTGYEHTVFGIHSKCNVKVTGNPLIRVVPPLPQIRVGVMPLFQTNDLGWNRDSSGSGSMENSPFRRGESQRSSVGPRIELDMIDGENRQVQFSLHCQKETAVESLSLTIKMTTGTSSHKPEEFCIVAAPSPSTINTLVPFAQKEQRTFTVDITAKFPTYYRVKNDFVSSLSRQQPSIDQRSAPCVAEDTGIAFVAKKHPFQKIQFRSSTTKRGATLAPKQSLPGGPERGLLPMIDSSLPNPTLVDSLNIDVPSPIRRSSAMSSLPSSSDSLPSAIIHSISPVPLKKGRGRGVVRTDSMQSAMATIYHHTSVSSQDEWDFNQFGNQRASIRSDPGDRKRETSSLSSRSPTSSGNTTPLRKSPSLASRTGSLTGDGETSPPQQSTPTFAYDHSSLPRPSKTAPPKSPSHYRPQIRRGPTNFKKNAISAPSDLRHNTLAILPTEVAVTNLFLISYSGGDGGKAGYHRQIESTVKVRIHPSLYFDDFNITAETGKLHLFCLSFYVHNKSGQIILVTCSHNNGEEGVAEEQSFRLMSRQKRKVFIFLRRFNLPPELQNTVTESNLAQLYSEQLAKMVTIRWSLENSDRSGVGDLVGIRLPLSMVHIIQPVPLIIDLVVNGHDLVMGSEFTEESGVGVPVNVQLTLTNNANYTISPSWLLVDACEFLGSRISRDLTGRMIHSGNLLQRTPQLEPGQKYQHQLSFIFFYKGHYHVEFKAYILSTTSHNKPSVTKSPSSAPTTEETDGTSLGSVSPTYIEQRATSPILRGSKSPTSPKNSESLLEYCGKFGGPIFAPLKVPPAPLRCQLTPSTARDDVNKTVGVLSPHDRLVSISEVSEIMRGNSESKNKQNSPNSQTAALTLSEQFTPPSPSPKLFRRERGTRRNLTSYSSMHKRLSHLSKHQVTGPVLSLKVIELSRTSRPHS